MREKGERVRVLSARRKREGRILIQTESVYREKDIGKTKFLKLLNFPELFSEQNRWEKSGAKFQYFFINRGFLQQPIVCIQTLKIVVAPSMMLHFTPSFNARIDPLLTPQWALDFLFNYEFRQFLGKIGPKINLSRNFTDFEVINHILL